MFRSDVRTGWSVPQLALMGFVLGAAAAFAVQEALLALFAAAGWTETHAAARELSAGWSSTLIPALWGGAWGGLLVPALIRAGDTLLWPVALAAGAIVPTLASSLVDAATAGEAAGPAGDNVRVTTLLVLNTAWALVTTLLFQFARTATSIVLLTRGMP